MMDGRENLGEQDIRQTNHTQNRPPVRHDPQICGRVPVQRRPPAGDGRMMAPDGRMPRRTPAGRSPANKMPAGYRAPGGQNGRNNPYRRPNKSTGPGDRIATVVIVVLLMIIASSVSVTVYSCSIRGGQGNGARPAITGSGDIAKPVDSDKVDDTGDVDDMNIGTAEPKPAGKLRVCIDPGHGYDDVGAESPNLGEKSEKDINLAVALKLAELLESEGFDVIMTRDSDTPPSTLKANDMGKYLINPTWRSEYANRNDVDLFISLHCNSYDSPATSGIRLYYCTDNTYGSSSFAAELSRAISSGMHIPAPDPTGYDADNAYTVTKRVNAPSVLVEMGFITNPSDARDLLSDTWQKDMARALADGIKAYLK